VECESDHSPPCSAEVKNGGAIYPLPHMSSWHRDKYTFLHVYQLCQQQMYIYNELYIAIFYCAHDVFSYSSAIIVEFSGKDDGRKTGIVEA
jgi:hypothetical protein